MNEAYEFKSNCDVFTHTEGAKSANLRLFFIRSISGATGIM